MTNEQKLKKFMEWIEPLGKLGLEIGPLDNPFVDKDKYNVKYVDIFDEKTLKEMYKADKARNVNNIEKLDYVQGGRKLSQCCNERFDYIVASHVLEHVPDLIGWLNDIELILSSGGMLFVVFPDCSYTFDVNRPKTSVGELLENLVFKRKRPAPRHTFDQRYYHKKVIAHKLWNDYESHREDHKEETPLTFNVQESFEDFQRAQKEYVDCHCNLFDPKSFKNGIAASFQLKFHKFRITHLIETQKYNHDFLALLSLDNSL